MSSNQQNRGRGSSSAARRVGPAPKDRSREGGTSTKRPARNRCRVKLDHDCEILIITFLRGYHGSLVRCAQVCRRWATVAIPLLWEDPMLTVLTKSVNSNEQLASKWKSFVTTSVACLTDDAKKALQEEGLSLPPECMRKPLFAYDRFLRRYCITVLEELCFKWTIPYCDTEGSLNWLLLQSLSSAFLDNGRINDLEFRNPYTIGAQLKKLKSRWLPSHTSLQHNLADDRWQSLKLTSLTTRGDIDLDIWHTNLSETCRDLKQIVISELAGEDRLGLEKLITKQHGLEEISIDGRMSGDCVSGAWIIRAFSCVGQNITRITLKGDLQFPVRALVPCVNLRYLCVESLYGTLEEGLRKIPAGTWLRLQTIKFAGLGATLIDMTAAIGGNLSKLSVEATLGRYYLSKRTDSNIFWGDLLRYLARTCPNLKELRVCLSEANNLELLFKFPCLQHLHLWHRQKKDVKLDDLFDMIIHERSPPLSRITFEGLYKMRKPAATMFFDWAKKVGMTVALDRRAKVRQETGSTPCRWYLRKYAMQGVVRHLSAEDFQERWET